MSELSTDEIQRQLFVRKTFPSAMGQVTNKAKIAVVMAFGPFLQHDHGPSQVLSPDSLHPSLPSPSLPLGYLHLNGLPRCHRSMDDPKWLFLLQPCPRLLESI